MTEERAETANERAVSIKIGEATLEESEMSIVQALIIIAKQLEHLTSETKTIRQLAQRQAAIRESRERGANDFVSTMGESR